MHQHPEACHCQKHVLNLHTCASAASEVVSYATCFCEDDHQFFFVKMKEPPTHLHGRQHTIKKQCYLRIIGGDDHIAGLHVVRRADDHRLPPLHLGKCQLSPAAPGRQVVSMLLLSMIATTQPRASTIPEACWLEQSRSNTPELHSSMA
jgi:hypothetical protein